MSSFRPYRKTNIARKNKVDFDDTNAFPSLNGNDNTLSTAHSISSLETSNDTCDKKNTIPWQLDNKVSSDSDEDTDKLSDGWIVLTYDDIRKPKPKPVIEVDSESESDDDDDTMLMTTKKKTPTKPITEPYTEPTSSEIFEMFRLEFARHMREIEDRENGIEELIYEDEWEQQRKWELYNNPIYDSMSDEEEDYYYEEEYEYD